MVVEIDMPPRGTVLLTGAPATGKSTLRQNLAQMMPHLQCFDYGQLLLSAKRVAGVPLGYDEMRQHSSAVISHSDVFGLDNEVVAEVRRIRQKADVLIDSHAVTKEAYGFRMVPFSPQQLTDLGIRAILMLTCEPEVLVRRIKADPRGRPVIDTELARAHQAMQAAVAINYAVLSHSPLFVIDTTERLASDAASLSSEFLLSVGIGSGSP